MVSHIPTLIVPVLTEHHRLNDMLASLGDVEVRDLIIIDNGDDPEFLPIVKNVQNLYYWNMPSNLGVAASWNLGIKATPFSPGWMIVNFDVSFGEGAVEQFMADCGVNNMVLGGKPPWACVWIGSQVVEQVGLFHEGFHPAYFEDNDYELRAKHHGVHIVHSMANIMHRNSSTLNSSKAYQDRNAHTFAENHKLFVERWAAGVPASEWSLRRRLDLSWD